MATPHLGLGILTESQESKELTVNQNSYLLDAVLTGVIALQTTPPGSPGEGDAYIVTATAIGAWAGRENQVAYWFNGGWSFLSPSAGLSLFVSGSQQLAYYNSGWKIYSPWTAATVNAQTGTAYTLTLTDSYSVVTMSNSSANTLTIPANASVAFPVGSMVEVWQKGAGVTTIAAAGGVTLNGVTAGSTALTARYGAVTLRKVGTNEWLIAGAIGSVS